MHVPGGASGREPACQCKTQSLGREDPLEKGMGTHSSILAWRIPRTEGPGGLQSIGCKESDTTKGLSMHRLHGGKSRWKEKRKRGRTAQREACVCGVKGQRGTGTESPYWWRWPLFWGCNPTICPRGGRFRCLLFPHMDLRSSFICTCLLT